MAKIKKLQDVYRFPGFAPESKIRGIFGDPLAVVITLRRRRKKRFAGSVEVGSRRSMTIVFDEFGTCHAATNESIWSSCVVG
jgi:hypothetical protein